MNILWLCLASLVLAQEPTCKEVKGLYKAPKGVNDTSCCKNPELGFERPLSHDSTKFLDPDEIMASLRDQKYTTKNITELAERAIKYIWAYEGILSTEVQYSVNAYTRGDFESGDNLFTKDFHSIYISAKRDPAHQCLPYHPKTRRADVTLRIYSDGSVEIAPGYVLYRRDQITGEYEITTKVPIAASHGGKCLGWSNMASLIFDAINPVIREYYNDPTYDFRTDPEASVTELLRTTDSFTYPGSLRIFMFSDAKISFPSFAAWVKLSDEQLSTFEQFADTPKILEFPPLWCERLDRPCPLRNDQVDFDGIFNRDPVSKIVGGVGFFPGVVPNGLNSDLLFRRRNDAKTLEEALQLMNTIRTEAGMATIPI